MKLAAVLCVLFAFAPVIPAAEDGPSYSHNPDSKKGPSLWGAASPGFATCGSVSDGKFVEVGKRQSPIDIVLSNVTASTLAPLQLSYEEVPLTVENIGHAIQVPYAGGGGLRFGNSPLGGSPFAGDTYSLVQFHFHTPSENTINGKQADMEVHFVHQNALGDLAVIGILMNRGSNPNLATDRIMANTPATVTKNTAAGLTINPRTLFPDTSLAYWTFSGSLTTPPCSEGVRWILLKDAVTISDFAYNQMRSILAGTPGNDGVATNSRPVLPLNGRPVLGSR